MTIHQGTVVRLKTLPSTRYSAVLEVGDIGVVKTDPKYEQVAVAFFRAGVTSDCKVWRLEEVI